jgi:antitoxin (DNA-binding transcriptional repressor) of toxin-antitoxin stability system
VVFQRPGSAALAVWTPVEDTATGTMRVDLPDAHLASGGLVVTASGEPVALVTAGRYEQCAPPVPNALPITRARPLVDAARARLASLPPPDATPLLPWPADSFTAAMLDSIADVAPLDRYEGLDELKAGHFKVRLTTPPLLLVESRAWNAQRRKNVEKWTKGAKGEEKACWEKVPRPPERERATSAALAAVAIHVNAQLTMTGGEKLYGITVAKPFIRMEGDLGGAVIYRNGEPVAPIVGGTDWRTHRLYTPKGQWADSAHIGWYLLPGTVLAPDPNGAPPTIALYLPDLRHPNEPSCLELRPDKVALLWNDFVPAYAKASPPPVRADPKAKPQTPRPAPGQACPVRSNRPF